VQNLPTAPSNGTGLSDNPRYVQLLYPSFFWILICTSATSVDVERLFSRGHLLLSHTRSRLSVASTRALLCLGSWSLLGLVRDEDVEAVSEMNDIDAEAELNRLGHILQAR